MLDARGKECYDKPDAAMVKSVDTADLKSAGAIRAGSSPASGTRKKHIALRCAFFNEVARKRANEGMKMRC